MPPNLVILHGEDELAISQRVNSILADGGEAPKPDIDCARLDGRSASMAELETAIITLPFFSPRRVVILTYPSARLAIPANKDKFTAMLGRIHPAVTLVLVEYKSLTTERDRRNKKVHWLETWAGQAGERVELVHYTLPKPGEMPARILEITKGLDGKISQQAARQLGILTGENPRVAWQEVQKLLAYVNYARPIEVEDVQDLIEDQAQGDIFNMVDAMGNRSARQAAGLLHRLLEQQETIIIFGMVVRQFRLLLLCKEIGEGRGNLKDFDELRRLPQFVTNKYYAQARRFSLAQLESIYRHFLEMDVSSKNSETDLDLALDTFIASIAA